MEMVLPASYVVVEEEEMMYLDVGGLIANTLAVTGGITGAASGFLIGSVSGYTLGRTIETRVLGGK